MPTTYTNKPDVELNSAPALSKLEKAHQAGKKKWRSTAVFWSMAAFVSLNAALFAFNNDDKRTTKAVNTESKQDLWSGPASIDLAVNAFHALKERPTISLLGSSLIMHPFWAMDLAKNKDISDIFHYHNSIAMSDALKDAGVPDQRVFSFAIFGEMISDSYIYVNDFLKGDKKPDVIFFGIAPRDFSDSDLPAPMATLTFKHLVGLPNFNRYADAYLPGFQDKADFIASHACFFYGKRWRLQHEVTKAFEKIYDRLGLQALCGELILPEQSAEKSVAGFTLTGTLNERWTGSLKEYKHRYRDIDKKDLSVQFGFLDRLLKTCANRDIRVVVVNMPLTAENRALLPDGFYDTFRQRIKETANRPLVQFVDLGSAPQFTKKDFWDTAHLNHLGGYKLIAATLPYMKKALTEAQLERTASEP